MSLPLTLGFHKSIVRFVIGRIYSLCRVEVCPEGTCHHAISRSFRSLFGWRRLSSETLYIIICMYLNCLCRWSRNGSEWNVRNPNGKDKLLKGCAMLPRHIYVDQTFCSRLIKGCLYNVERCMLMLGCPFMTTRWFSWYF